ncbi:MAG: PQQ-binding-like beta-propeller repeat protein [Halobacteriaceae archaeon]
MSSLPTLSRRRVLGAGAVAAIGALAGCSTASPVDSAPWSPPTDAWPQARYGPRNTGRNPNAAVPVDGVSERWRAPAPGEPSGVVAQREHLAAFGPAGLVVLDRASDETVHTDHVPAERVAFGPPGSGGEPDLYAAGAIGLPDGTDVTAVRAWELGDRTGQRFLTVQRGLGRQAIDHLIAGEGRLYVGGRGEGRTTTAIEAATGDTVWRATGARPALIDDGVLTGSQIGVACVGPRGGLDALVNDGPRLRWETHTARTRTPPAVTDDTAVVGTGGVPGTPSGVVAVSTVDGDHRWEPVETPAGVRSVAIDGDTALSSHVVTETVGRVAVPTSGGLRAVGLSDGRVDWERGTDWVPHCVALDGEGLAVVAGGHPPGERYPDPPDPDRRDVLRCHAVATGERLWRHRTPTPVEAVALVGETVYAVCAGGSGRALG